MTDKDTNDPLKALLKAEIRALVDHYCERDPNPVVFIAALAAAMVIVGRKLGVSSVDLHDALNSAISDFPDQHDDRRGVNKQEG